MNSKTGYTSCHDHQQHQKNDHDQQADGAKVDGADAERENAKPIV